MSMMQDILDTVDSLIENHKQVLREYLGGTGEYSMAEYDDMRHTLNAMAKYIAFRKEFANNLKYDRNILSEMVEFIMDMQEG